MAIGDDAVKEGWSTVPETGEEGKVRWGAREINRTRDLIAIVKRLIPIGKSGYRNAAGISSGTGDPNNGSGDNGDIYLKIL